jgi:MFS family permease
MKKEDSASMIRKFIVGASAIALLLIVLAIITSIAEIKDTYVGEVISMAVLLKLIILLIIMIVVIYLLSPTSAALSRLIINLSRGSDAQIDEMSYKNIRTFSSRIVGFIFIPILFGILIGPFRDIARLAENLRWMPMAFAYIMLAAIIIALIVLLVSIGPLVEALRKPEKEEAKGS